MRDFFRSFCLAAEFEVKAARLGSLAGLPGLLAYPVFYSFFVVTALSSNNGSADPAMTAFIAVGVVGMQAVSMMSQVIYRWTLERKWSLGCLKLASGVTRAGYYAGMLCVPLITLFIQSVCVVGVAEAVTGLRAPIDAPLLAGGVVLCGLFWSAAGCGITAAIRSYRARDVAVSLLMTPLMFSAPTLYSLDQAPAFLRVIAAANPLTYQLGLMRSLSAGAVPADGLLVVFAITVCMVCLGYLSTAAMRTVSNEGA